MTPCGSPRGRSPLSKPLGEPPCGVCGRMKLDLEISFIYDLAKGVSIISMEGGLIRDFAILIGTAGVAGFIFHFLRLPLLLGYILSGLIIGPHLFFSQYIQNYEILQQFGDLGVIFLMFYIGLEFDLDKLRRTLGPSLLVVIFQTVVMMFVGILSAKFLGWSGLNGLFLGALMAISSTMMTIPVLKDRKKG